MAKRNSKKQQVVSGSVDSNLFEGDVEMRNDVENVENVVDVDVDGVENGAESVENNTNNTTNTTTPAKKTRGPQVPVREFLRVWQTSSSLEEVASTLNMKPQSVYVRALSYKKKGINLKDMPKGERHVGAKKLDADELNRFLEELNS